MTMTRIRISDEVIRQTLDKLRSLNVAQRLGAEKKLIIFDMEYLGSLQRTAPGCNLYAVEKSEDGKVDIVSYRWYPARDEQSLQEEIELHIKEMRCVEVTAHVWGNRILSITSVNPVEELDIPQDLVYIGRAYKTRNSVLFETIRGEQVLKFFVQDRSIKGAKLCGMLKKPGDEVSIAAILYWYKSMRSDTLQVAGIHFWPVEAEEVTEEVQEIRTEEQTEETPENTEVHVEASAVSTETEQQTITADPASQVNISLAELLVSENLTDIFDQLAHEKILSPVVSRAIVEKVLPKIVNDSLIAECDNKSSISEKLICILEKVPENILQEVNMSTKLYFMSIEKMKKNLDKVENIILKVFKK